MPRNCRHVIGKNGRAGPQAFESFAVHRRVGRIEQEHVDRILRNQALHVPDALPDRAAVKRYIDNGLRVFLKAYSTDPTSDLDQLKRLCEQAPTPTGTA